jgi:hypothetical protein
MLEREKIFQGEFYSRMTILGYKLNHNIENLKKMVEITLDRKLALIFSRVDQRQDDTHRRIKLKDPTGEIIGILKNEAIQTWEFYSPLESRYFFVYFVIF